MSVIVPVRDESRWIDATARGILGQATSRPLEVLFVDGGSTDGTRERLESLAAGAEGVHVLDNPDGRIPQALNIGLRAAQGEFIARMDAHSVFPAGYAEAGVRRLEAGGVDWVAGPVEPLPHGGWSGAVAGALATRLGMGGSLKWGAGEDAEERDLDTGVFAGVWRRDLLRSYGGWDEGWPVNEDAELASRMLADGRRIVCLPAMRAGYYPRDRLGPLVRQYGRFGYYRVKTAGRHPAALRRQHLAAPGLVATLAVACGRGRTAWLARGALGLYAGALAVEGSRGGRSAGESPARVAVALAAMHAGWGAGFLAGSARFGPPARAIMRSLRGAQPTRKRR